MKALRWGIIGSGRISERFGKALNYGNPEHHQIAAIAASSEAKADDLKRSIGLEGTMTMGSYFELINSPEIDAVHIGLGNFQHKDWTIKALNAGKHVLCEKPMGLNAQEVRDMIAAAESNGCFLMEGLWSRCFPAYHRIRKAVRSKEIGEAKVVTANFGCCFAEEKMSAELGGGSLMYLGCYLIMFSHYVFEEAPTNISARGFLQNDVDELAAVTLEFSGGRTAQLACARPVEELPAEARVFGTEGSIWRVEGKFQIPENMSCPTAVVINGKREEFPLPNGAEEMGTKAGFYYEAEAVRNAVQQGSLESEMMPWKESIEIAKVLEECRRQIGVRFSCD